MQCGVAVVPVAGVLRRLGIGAGSCIVVHAAFRHLSRQGMQAEQFADALLDVVSPGTVVMPAMSWRAVNPDNPVFDELSTPSITGVLSEVFRTRFASHRSLHPTHSVAAFGEAAGHLTDGHHRDRTPCGPGSPWGRLAETDAIVLMLGTGMETCTILHHVEEAFAPERYLRDQEETYQCIDRHHNQHMVVTRRHKKLNRNFWKFEQMLRQKGLVLDADLHGVPAFAFRARDLMNEAAEHMRVDPFGTLAAPGEPGKLM